MKKYLFIIALSLGLFWGSQAKAAESPIASTKAIEALVDAFSFQTDGTIEVSVDKLIVDNIVIDGTSVLSDTGTLTLGGTGGTNNEDLTFDFESQSNIVTIDSSTGGSLLEFGISLTLKDNETYSLGTNNDARFVWETLQAKDSFQLGLVVGADETSGYFSLMERADLSMANRSPLATSADPVLRIYSSDATEVLDYIEQFHDQANANIQWGNGYLSLTDNGTETARFDWDDTGSNTPMLLLDSGGTIRRVTTGNNDSGDSGFRVLQVPNL